MLHDTSTPGRTLGADLRALRKSRGFTLVDLAAKLGKSVGWLSQVERDLSEPSISDLRGFAAVLDVQIASLFRAVTVAREDGLIVRGSARRPIGSRKAGSVEELLSPDLTDDFIALHTTFEPHSALTDPVVRPTQEVGYVISGACDLWIDGLCFHLDAGDSFRIRGQAYRWANPHDDPCAIVWVIAPPVY